MVFCSWRYGIFIIDFYCGEQNARWSNPINSNEVYRLTCCEIAVFSADGVRQNVGPQGQKRLLPRQVAQFLGDNVDGVVVTPLW